VTQPTVVLYSGDDPVLARIADAVRAAFAAPDEEPDDDESTGALALPVSDDAGPMLAGARVAIVLDPESRERAREASVPRTVALLPTFDTRWDAELDVDLVLVAHEGMRADALRAGASAVTAVGPVAPAGWAPAEDRAALKAELGPRSDVPWVVVRAAALDLDDLAPSLVQLSLVGVDAVWLFDVGLDPDAARRLRGRVPGYGLDSYVFSDPDALSAYQAADVVFGRLDGPELVRAFSVGASVVTPRPRAGQLAIAHVIETDGIADVADAAATLSVTFDHALAPTTLEAARARVAALDAAGGAARVVEAVAALDRPKDADALPAGLPRGLERLSDPEDAIEGFPVGGGDERPAPSGDDELDKKVDEELAALREKLGL